MTQKWTGERLETFITNETAIEHLHRYAIAMEFVKDMHVLDIACGEGYGSNLLAEKASSVTGVDIDPETIEKAKKKYKNSKLNFVTGNVLSIPFPVNSFDIVLSFETLEHIAEHHEMMREIKRVLKPGGLLIISTPDKYYHSDINTVKSGFHVKELYKEEFELLIRGFFKNTIFLQQKSMLCSVITPFNKDKEFINYEGDYSKIESKNSLTPVFHIAIASDKELSSPTGSIFNGTWSFLDMLSERDVLVKKSITYKVGHLILYPFKKIWSVFRKN